MQTIPHPLTALPVAGALLILPSLLQADLLTPDRLTPLASDYLQPPTEPADPTANTTTTPSEPAATEMPAVVVSAPPVDEIKLANTMTDAARTEFAEQRYFTGATDTLNRVTLPLFGRDRKTIAVERLREDERLAGMNALDEQIARLSTNDSAAADQLREMSYATYLRSQPF